LGGTLRECNHPDALRTQGSPSRPTESHVFESCLVEARASCGAGICASENSIISRTVAAAHDEARAVRVGVGWVVAHMVDPSDSALGHPTLRPQAAIQRATKG
jgi:hypothetical protein